MLQLTTRREIREALVGRKIQGVALIGDSGEIRVVELVFDDGNRVHIAATAWRALRIEA